MDEWKRLWDLLDRWECSVAGKGFMDPVLYKEDGQVFTTIWFTRGVCGRYQIRPCVRRSFLVKVGI